MLTGDKHLHGHATFNLPTPCHAVLIYLALQVSLQVGLTSHSAKNAYGHMNHFRHERSASLYACVLNFNLAWSLLCRVVSKKNQNFTH
jgi:hypothetical protein